MAVPDLHELATAVEAAAGELRLLREQQAADQAANVKAIRRRTHMLAWLMAAVLLVGVGVSVAGFAFTRMVHCRFYEDLQPPPGQPQPVGEYGQRILTDAKSAADRLHC
jgi:hypothetical protein